jgi:hypothetical protein
MLCSSEVIKAQQQGVGMFSSKLTLALSRRKIKVEAGQAWRFLPVLRMDLSELAFQAVPSTSKTDLTTIPID